MVFRSVPTQGPLTAESRGQFIARTGAVSRELVVMVNTLIDTGLGEGGDHLVLQPLPLLDSIQGILGLRERILQRAGLTVRVAVPATLHVLAAPLKLEEIVHNLLNTASKRKRAGGVIHIASHAEGEMTVVHVDFCCRDMPHEEEEEVFQRLTTPFGQLAGAPEVLFGQVRGSSLGLYASKMVLEGMGGRLWLERGDQDRGVCSFAFCLLSVPGDPQTMQNPRIEQRKRPTL